MKTIPHAVKDLLLALDRWSSEEPLPKIRAAFTSHRSGENGRLKRTNLTMWVLTVISLLCLLLIISLTIFYKPAGTTLSMQLVTSLFIAICCLGATAALLPSKCSRMLHQKQVRGEQLSESDRSDEADRRPALLSGHHPTCGSFTSHVLRIRGKTYCAGCMGLLTGALSAITASLMYSLQIMAVKGEATFLFWAGSFSVLLGLLQYARPLMMNGWVHYLLNTLFVSGTFLLLLGVLEINGTLIVETYFLLILLYWVLARIMLSNLEHQKICLPCDSSSCVFRPNS